MNWLLNILPLLALLFDIAKWAWERYHESAAKHLDDKDEAPDQNPVRKTDERYIDGGHL